MDLLGELAVRQGLEDCSGESPTGLPERYPYSTDMRYRYAFARWWGVQDLASTDVWVLLNPATGDTDGKKRPTLQRCMARSKEAGHSGLLIVALFAWRCTDPKQLRSSPDPVGPANDDVLRRLTSAAPRTTVAWGAGGRMGARSSAVAPLLTRPLCMGTTSRGEPRHPLYVRTDAPLVPWQAPPRPS